MACVLLCAMVVLPVGLGAAGEQTRVKKAPESFEEIDANGDGFIDAKEAWGMAYSASSLQLQGPVAAEQIVSYFQYLDANGDGFIDVKEAQVIADNATSQQAASVKPITGEQILAFMDTNRDGKISKDELVAMAAFQTKSQQAGTAERKAAEKIVRSMDANRDGKISKDEISTVLKPYFEQIDTNGDGFIDAREAWGMAYSASSR
jgi:Ca2+-binding EF-hand superfamily protein